MRKIYICFFLTLAPMVQLGAQSIYDAMTTSENQYFGTARSMSLGNAVTALGGDIGMAAINPAGGAVAGYSQIEITPGLSISSISSAYSPSYGEAFNQSQNSSGTRFIFPSGGVNLRFDCGRTTGLRSVNLTMGINSANFYTSGMDNTGVNSRTSKFAEFATAADGVPVEMMTYSKQRNMWDVVNAFESGTIAAISDRAYMGASEYLSADGKYHYIPGELRQNNIADKHGHKSDILIGFSGNISDKFYVGINLGIPLVRSENIQTYKESAVDPKLFPAVFVDSKGERTTTYYESGLYEFRFSTRASGTYGKIGFLAVPKEWVRVGLAVSTPNKYAVSESWQFSGQVTYQDSRYSTSRTNSTISSNGYTMRGAWELNAGVAFVAGTRGLLSIDYEMTDYSHMAYFGSSSFDHINTQISYFCGQSHNVRAGLEVRATEALSLRAGWTIQTCPEKYYVDANGVTVNPVQFEKQYQDYTSGRIELGRAKYYSSTTSTYNLGAGYSLDNGLFFDLAARLTTYPAYEYFPYYDYKNYDKSGAAVNVKSPVISCTRKLWTVALTLGWRF